MCVGTPSASPPIAGQVRFGLGARVGLAARDDDLGACGHEAFGDRSADAPRPAGDDGDPVGQIEECSQLFGVHGDGRH